MTGDEEREGHVLGDGPPRQQLEVLEHDADATAEARDLRAAHAHDVLPVDEDVSRRGQLFADQQPDDGRLPRPGRSDKEDEIAVADVQIDVA